MKTGNIKIKIDRKLWEKNWEEKNMFGEMEIKQI